MLFFGRVLVTYLRTHTHEMNTCSVQPREHCGDDAQMKDNVHGFRGTYGRGAPAEEGDIWGDGGG